MGAPTRPVPTEQQRRFGLAVCARLGLDPALVFGRFGWKVEDENLGTVTFTVALPAGEILAMWNGAAPIVRPTEEPAP